MKSGLELDIKQCLICQQTVKAEHSHCIRCGSEVSKRKVNSLATSWALIICGLLSLFPANLYPITYLHSHGAPLSDTIMSGVISLIHSDMLGIAIIVFVASIVVPVMKLLGLAYILYGIHYQVRFSNKQKIILYRAIDVIGKWSMLDLFVLSIVISVFEYNQVVAVTAGPGATAFAVVVILTLFAAKSFDTRLIWDE